MIQALQSRFAGGRLLLDELMHLLEPLDVSLLSYFCLRRIRLLAEAPFLCKPEVELALQAFSRHGLLMQGTHDFGVVGDGLAVRLLSGQGLVAKCRVQGADLLEQTGLAAFPHGRLLCEGCLDLVETFSRTAAEVATCCCLAFEGFSCLRHGLRKLAALCC